MAQVSYKNSRNGDVVTLDTSTEDGKRSADRLKGLDNWTKTSPDEVTAPPAPVKKPGDKAGRAELLKYALAHASSEEQAALEQMTDDALRAFVKGKDGSTPPPPAAGTPAAGPAAGV